MTLMMRERINYEKGQEYGEKKELNKIIFNMIEQGYSNEQIMAVCGVSEEEVDECRNIN